MVIEKSLVQVIPLTAGKCPSPEIVVGFFKYLRSIKGENEIIAQLAVNQMLEDLTNHK
jgi:hypothetical protein